MGSGSSQLSGIDVEEKPVHVSERWTLYTATVNAENSSVLSVFIGPAASDGTIKAVGTSLEKAAKNLMLYRHPCIVRFVATWSKHGRVHLATESVVPLAHVLQSQTPLQICIGLHSVLRALVFLHQKASASHNNVCSASVYVTADGAWKLGGLDYLCRFSDMTPEYLQELRVHRCEKSIAPEEEQRTKSFLISEQPTCVDQFAFGCLVEEVLRDRTGDIPGLPEFVELCRKQLQNPEPSVRPLLPSLVSHPFFTHTFIRIHSFLEELPLKSSTEKEAFFRSLVDELPLFPEELVASQLGSLLLARLVLLDNTAQACLLPLVLCPRTETREGLFTVKTYRKYLVPRLLQIFCVRDAQVRLLLLNHFHSYCHVFLEDELKDQVLPELLVGIKDTNDTLVSMTLRALAELVPRLGAATVIGGKRGKLFTDGRPKAPGMSTAPTLSSSPSKGKTTTPKHLAALSTKLDTDSGASYETLPERPSPDGGEDHMTTDEDTEAWSDWDNEEAEDGGVKPQSGAEPPSPGARSTVLADISLLDVKSSAAALGGRTEEIDFFQDMEPVISKAKVVTVEDAASCSKFDVTVATEEEDGWGEDLDDWGDVESYRQDG